VDQDSGRGTGRSVARRENRAGPRHRPDTDRPPSEAANPLPRRSAHGHIEPQLRTPGGAGDGTPFSPFGSDGELAPADSGRAVGRAAGRGPSSPSPDGSGDPAEGSAAAEFHEGASRGRRSTEPPTG
jgi:hypothetical protein